MAATGRCPLGVWRGTWQRDLPSGVIFGGGGGAGGGSGGCSGEGEHAVRGMTGWKKHSEAEGSLHSQRWLGRVRNRITYFVILNILRSRRARKTLIPKDVPGLKMAQTTSKMLPTVT